MTVEDWKFKIANMIDTHAHLNFPQLTKIIDQVVSESKAAGVTNIIIASSNLEDSKIAIELAQEYPGFLFASVGIHPHKTDPENKATIKEQLRKLDLLITSNLSQVIAIGETGLDFSPAPPDEKDRPREGQKELFLGQINLAKKFNLSIIIHAREAIDEVINIITNISEVNFSGTFHCYAGGKKRISKILNLPNNWYFGFDGNLTYDEGLQKIIQLIPPERLLIETDSPFLAPVPHRGEVNTPAYLPLIQQKINDILGKDLTKQIEENSRRLFCL